MSFQDIQNAERALLGLDKIEVPVESGTALAKVARTWEGGAEQAGNPFNEGLASEIDSGDLDGMNATPAPGKAKKALGSGKSFAAQFGSDLDQIERLAVIQARREFTLPEFMLEDLVDMAEIGEGIIVEDEDLPGRPLRGRADLMAQVAAVLSPRGTVDLEQAIRLINKNFSVGRGGEIKVAKRNYLLRHDFDQHERMIEVAAAEGISINTWLDRLIKAELARYET